MYVCKLTSNKIYLRVYSSYAQLELIHMHKQVTLMPFPKFNLSFLNTGSGELLNADGTNVLFGHSGHDVTKAIKYEWHPYAADYFSNWLVNI